MFKGCWFCGRTANEASSQGIRLIYLSINHPDNPMEGSVWRCDQRAGCLDPPRPYGSS